MDVSRWMPRYGQPLTIRRDLHPPTRSAIQDFDRLGKSRVLFGMAPDCLDADRVAARDSLDRKVAFLCGRASGGWSLTLARRIRAFRCGLTGYVT